MNVHLLPAFQLSWSPTLRVTRVEGDCEAVLHRPLASLLEQPLPATLGLSQEQARALDALAREDRRAVSFVSGQLAPGTLTPLRLVLGLDGGEASASVMDVRAVLEGAPPVQVSRISSSLSHEIRNPLSSVKMATQTLARNTGLNERDQRRLAIANREIRTMERMLWLLSEYGRESLPNLEPQAPRGLVQEAAAMVAPELAERRLEVRVQEEAELPRVRADAGRMRPVLAQALLNAAQALPEGSALEVSVRQASDGRVHLSWTDAAAALPPEERATLFEPFGSRLARGAGLSLAALRRAMLAQGGDVAVEGGAEPGVVFTLMFAV